MNLTIYIGLVPNAADAARSSVEVFTTQQACDEWMQAALHDRNQDRGVSFVRVLGQPVALNDRLVN